MNAGRMRQLITIQNATSTTDNTGQETYTYTTAASKVWADVRNTSQRKTEDGFVQNSGAETYEVWIRYRPDVNYNTRILFDGLTLSVVNIEDQRQLRHALRLRCEAVNR